MFPVVNVAIGILINSQGEILLSQRPEPKPFAGLWEFLGGKIEEGETASCALRRELQEEVGIGVTEDSLLLLGNLEHTYPEFLFCSWVFRCPVWQGEPQPLEGQKLEWVKSIHLLSYPVLPACKKIFLSFLESAPQKVKK